MSHLPAASGTAPPTRRPLWLRIGAALTLAATAWTALQVDDGVPPSTSTSTSTAAPRRAALSASHAAFTSTSTSTSTPHAADWPRPPTAADRAAWPAAGALAVAAWTAPPPPPTPPPAPKPVAVVAPPPQAPTFPYTPIGRLDDGVPMLLLAGPLRSFGVKAADVIDGRWRVDGVDARGLSLTWLPGNLKTHLAFSAPAAP